MLVPQHLDLVADDWRLVLGGLGTATSAAIARAIAAAALPLNSASALVGIGPTTTHDLEDALVLRP